MSVYTAVSKDELIQFLEAYRVGRLLSFKGIDEGIENTNYFVDTSEGRYVLTIFEWLAESELPYFLDLMAHVAATGTPCPRPVADAGGSYLGRLANKPAALITRLAGKTVAQPAAAHCRRVGGALAALHRATSTFKRHRANNRGVEWCRTQGHGIQSRINGLDRELLLAEIEYQTGRDLAHLPGGIIHADLFRDNVLFDGDELSGIIDLYYMCDDALLYDIAVTVNDWCRNGDASIDEARYNALINAYRRHRPFTPDERDAWQDVMRRAALRFWTSRLRDYCSPREGELTHLKDPDTFRNILRDCRRRVPPLPA